MVRKASTKPITAELYRHFAAVTVACTLALAMFANGDSRQAVAREVAAAGLAAAEERPADFVRRDTVAHGSFGNDDFDGSYGQPMEGGSTVSTGIVPGEFLEAPLGQPSGFNVYGVSQATWATLSEEQKRMLIEAHARSRKEALAPGRATQIETLMAASRARSGEASAAD
jgi:hypothetical protein